MSPWQRWLRDPRRWLEVTLAAVLVLISAQNALELIRFHELGVDAQIPLLAAERWLAGGDPYPASAFEVERGPGLPFLYPPYVLPFIGPFTLLPPIVVILAALIGSLVMAAWATRRLGLPWRFVPVIMLWPPFVEAIVGTNVELLGFAALVALTASRSSPLPTRRAGLATVLAAATFVFKVAQVQVLAHVLGRRPRVAIGAVVAVGVLAIATLPAIGLDRWLDWFGSGMRAGDPAWGPIGAPLSTIVPRPLALAATLASILVASRIGDRHATAWLGLLIIVGAPSLHLFGFVYLLPALLIVRRDIALALAALAATAVAPALWIAVAVAALLLLASRYWPVALLHPTAGTDRAGVAP